jgi:hypothetical protein
MTGRSTAHVGHCFLASVFIARMKATIRGRVRNTKLAKTKPLMPLFEAVINAFQSTDEAGGSGHVIDISVERESPALGLPTDKHCPIIGFSVADTGIGFTDSNFQSFDEMDSPYKAAQGGKGLGRFYWLVAFDGVRIESDYRGSAGQMQHRWFDFVPGDSIEPPGGKHVEI